MQNPCNSHASFSEGLLTDEEDFSGIEDYDQTLPAGELEEWDDDEDSFDLTWYEETDEPEDED